MDCICKNNEVVDDSKIILQMKENFNTIKVDAYNWKIIFQCKYCGTIYEQRHYGGTHDEDSHLIQVTREYVLDKWGINI